MFRRLRSLSHPAVAVLLVVCELVGLAAVFIIGAVVYLGLAATIANVSASGKTAEKAIILGLFSEPWLPVVVVLATVALTVFLCVRFYVATRPTHASRAPHAADSSTGERNPDRDYILENNRRELAMARSARTSAERHAEALERVARAAAAERDEARESLARVSDALEKQSVVSHILDKRLQDVTNERDQLLAKPLTLRDAVFRFVKNVREKHDSVPNGLTTEEEFEAIWEDFQATYWPQMERLKERLKTVLPAQSVAFLGEPMPWSKDALRQIAQQLEKEGLRVPADVLE